ncbi:hypothetical protein Ddye_005356 [Dipteronia dyeriana]|uniref:Uncharacterized protein n=1 Tax=Dipteronia dyeriana TaxID=168575 RepID=A0AAD9XGY1_9ROSI|nr:hypothetical protein Ddye_005356 [Dipteronia dyeriana]
MSYLNVPSDPSPDVRLVPMSSGLEKGDFNGPSDFPILIRKGEKRIITSGYMGNEQFQNLEVMPLSINALDRGLAVASRRISKKKGWRLNSHLLRNHNMKTRSISAGETIMHQKYEDKEKVVWNLEDKIVKVIERGMTLGLDFIGRKKEILDMIAGKDNRFRAL